MSAVLIMSDCAKQYCLHQTQWFAIHKTIRIDFKIVKFLSSVLYEICHSALENMCCSLTIVQIHIHCVKLFCMSLLVACKHSYFLYKTEVRASKRNYNAQKFRNMLWNGLLRKYAVLSVMRNFIFVCFIHTCFFN